MHEIRVSMSEGQQSEGFHLDKRISLGHIVTTISVSVAAALWMSKIDGKVDINTIRINGNTDTIKQLKIDSEARHKEVMAKLNIIDSRIFDHQTKHDP